MANTKIEKCKEKLLKALLIAEGEDKKDAPNYNHYQLYFDSMEDKEFIDFVKGGIMRVKVLPLEQTFKLVDVVKAMKEVLGRNFEEKVTLPFMMDDPDLGTLISDKKVMILRLPTIKLMQTALGENRHAETTTMRDKSNQVVNQSKGAGVSDMEVAQLLAAGYDNTIKEFYTFRADNDIAKNEAYSNIARTGRTNIPEAPDEGKVALKYITACYVGMGIDPEFINIEENYDKVIGRIENGN